MADDLLERLADGTPHTLAELALTPGELAPILEQMRDLGLVVRVVNDAVQIPGGVELLNRNQILDGLSATARDALTAVEVHRTIASTNDYLMARQLEGRCHAVACFAEQQTQGRGRRGRQWVSPFGCNLYLSVAWQMPTAGESVDGLSLAVGVAAIEALQRCGARNLLLKWPNDLLHEGSKLGGILVEMTAPRGGTLGLVVGIGINLRMPADASRAIDQRWTDLATVTGTLPSRNRVAGSVLDALTCLLDSFPVTGFKGYRARWEELDGLRGLEVELRLGERTVVGREMGVDASGALKLMTATGEMQFSGGEISLRPV